MSETIRLYGPFVVMAVQILFVWVLWSLSKKFCTVEKCEQHRKDRSATNDATKVELSGDLDELRTRIERLPDRTEIQDLSKEMSEMNKALGKLEGQLSGIGRAVDLMNQHLISKGHGD